MRNKIILLILNLFFLNSCIQSTTMIGPVYTIASTGNVAHAGLSIGANKAVEKETGMTTTQFLKNSIEEKQKQKNVKNKINFKVFSLVNNNIKKTRNKLFAVN